MTGFHAPEGDEPAGHHSWHRPHSPYERYMEEQGIPIYRGIGVYDVRQLPLEPWRRMGGRGSLLALDGLASLKGMYVLEVPAAGAVNAERHLYDEFMYVVEGRGTTEVWSEGSSKKQVFEWQAGSLFALPTNTWHRLVNASSSPALVLAANNAPPIMNIFQTPDFIFNCPYQFRNRYDESDDFFKAKENLEPDPLQGRAMLQSNVFPDILNCELALDNQRAPGYRRIQPGFRGYEHDGTTGGFIAQYPSGRYSKAHFHQSGAVLVCLRGKGYTYNWPTTLGPRPWEAGKGHLVKVQEYGAGGLVAAAPGGGSWFHQHFSIGKEPMRLINFWGGPQGRWGSGEDSGKEEIVNPHIYGVEEGGRSIHYHNEDPHIRKAYKEALAREGVECRMDESLFDKPVALN